MDFEQFSYLASAIESLVLAVAVIGGGVWALYQFRSLRKIETARTELEKVRRSLRERVVLNITMEPSQLTRSDSARYISVKLDIENTGSRTEVINWRDSKLLITKATIDEDGRKIFGDSIHVDHDLPGIGASASAITPGQTESFQFLVSVSEPGVYHLLFQAETSPEEASLSDEEYGAAGIVEKGQIWHMRGMYINVE